MRKQELIPESPMILRERFEDYRRHIGFADLDLASRAMAVLWLDTFRARVMRSCFPHLASDSLRQEVEEIINSTFLEGYVLARAAAESGTGGVIFSDPDIEGSVEEGLDRLRLMYEEEAMGEEPFCVEPLGVESLAASLVRETIYGPQLVWLEERELLKVHLIYALWAGYKLAHFERRLSGESN
jgi:hypothetical protein